MNWLSMLQIVIGLLLIFLILLQAKGTGLGTAFGGQANIYQTKKGIEKFVFYLTVFLVAALAVTAIVNLAL